MVSTIFKMYGAQETLLPFELLFSFVNNVARLRECG